MKSIHARAALVQLNPIITAEAIKSPITKDNPTGISVRRLRFADAIEAVGWDEIIKLAEVRRLIREMEAL